MIYNKMFYRNLNDTSSRCFLIVFFLKISFRHLKKTFSRQNSFYTKLSCLKMNWYKSSRLWCLSDIFAMCLQVIASGASFLRCFRHLTQILPKQDNLLTKLSCLIINQYKSTRLRWLLDILKIYLQDVAH